MASTVGDMVARLRANTKQYEKGMSDAVKRAKATSDGIKQQLSGGGIRSTLSNLAGSVKTAVGNIAGSLGKTIGPAAAKMGSMLKSGAAMGAKAIAGLAAGVAVAGGAIVAAFAAIGVGAYKLAQSSAPIQGVKTAFMGLASTVEGGGNAMLAALQKTSMGMISNADLMTQFNKAAQLVSVDFASKLPDAMEALTKVAGSTGQDLDYLFNSLTTGIGRMSPMILDNLAITVDAAAANRDWAAANNTTAEAMSKAQKQAALMDQVVTRLKANTANIPSVFGSAQQVFSAFGVELRNIKDDVGMDLLPTFTKMFNFFQQMLPAVRAFGQGFAGTFSGIVQVGGKVMKGFMHAMGVDMDNLSGSAGSWGENIVMSLARGMVRAIGAVISALTTLGNIIAGWLSPGSPPKLLPKLPAWGANIANQLFKGMGMGDVSLMSDLSSQVSGFIQSTMSGKSQKAIAQATLDARAAIEQAIASGGNLTAAVPAQLQDYVKALLAQKSAADEVTKAQERLNKITQKYEQALSPISARLAEIQAERDEFIAGQRRDELAQIIQQASAAGDTQAVRFAELELEELDLQDQQAELEALQAAEEGVAQAALTAAEERAAAAQEQLDVQQQLLAHQIETNNLMAQLAETTTAAGGAMAEAAGGAAGLVESLEEMAAGGGMAAGGLGSSISEMAAGIIAEFDKLTLPALKLGETWGTVFGEIISWWKTNFGEGGVWPGIVKNASNIITSQWGPGGTWEGNMKNLQAIGEILVSWWQENWGDGGVWAGIIKNASTIINDQWGEGGTWSGIIDNIMTIAQILIDTWKEHWGAGGTWDGIINNAKDAMKAAKEKILGYLESIEAAVEPVVTAIDSIKEAAQKFWDFLQTHVFSFNLNLPELPDWAWPTHSPMPIHYAMRDFEQYLSSADFAPRNGLEDYAIGANVTEAINGRSGGSSGGGDTYKIGEGANINNGMDMATFELMVRRAVRKEMR